VKSQHVAVYLSGIVEKITARKTVYGRKVQTFVDPVARVEQIDTQNTDYKNNSFHIRKFFSVIIWIIAIILILRTIGYNVNALMAGLGLGGAALALASKDTLANFFGSITVFFDRPFRMNDRIKIGGYDGVITEVGFRTSRLRTQENRTVFIPNSLFASQPIENISVQPNIKVIQTIRFKGDNGSKKIERGLEIIREIAADDPGLEGKATAGLISVGGLNCQANFIYFVSKKADYNETLNRVNMEILRRFEEAEIRLA
jgi:MscS family membrane protein